MKFAPLLALCFALAACSKDAETPETPQEPIACAHGKGAEFAENCTMEWGADGAEEVLIIRHADGAFRRFSYDKAKDALNTADGADEAVSKKSEDGKFLEIAVGKDRYRIPLADKPAEKQSK